MTHHDILDFPEEALKAGKPIFPEGVPGPLTPAPTSAQQVEITRIRDQLKAGGMTDAQIDAFLGK